MFLPLTAHTRGSCVPREHLYGKYWAPGRGTFGRAHKQFLYFDYKYVNVMGFVDSKCSNIVARPVAVLCTALSLSQTECSLCAIVSVRMRFISRHVITVGRLNIVLPEGTLDTI